MLKTLCLFFALILTSHLKAQQQREVSNPLNFGLRAGATFSKIHIADGRYFAIELKEGTGRVSYSFGAFFSWKVANKSRVQCELNYSRLGGAVKRHVGPYTPGITEYRLNYVSVPVLFRQNVSEKAIVELGPEFSFLISQNGKKKMDNYDFSAVAGAGYFFSSRLMINRRYHYGLNDINKFPDTERIGRWHSRTAEVGFSYMIRRGL